MEFMTRRSYIINKLGFYKRIVGFYEIFNLIQRNLFSIHIFQKSKKIKIKTKLISTNRNQAF